MKLPLYIRVGYMEGNKVCFIEPIRKNGRLHLFNINVS